MRIETLLWSKKRKLRNENASGRINADVPRGWFEGVGCKVLRLALACGCAKGRISADVHLFTILLFSSLRVAISVVLCKLSCLFAEIWNNTFITISHSALMRFHFGYGSSVLVVDDSARCVIVQAISYCFVPMDWALYWTFLSVLKSTNSWLASYRIN